MNNNNANGAHTMTSNRIGPRMKDFLERVADANDTGTTVSKSFLIDSTAPKRTQDGQRQIIDKLLKSGLLKNLNGPEDPKACYSRRGAALIITAAGREALGQQASPASTTTDRSTS